MRRAEDGEEGRGMGGSPPRGFEPRTSKVAFLDFEALRARHRVWTRFGNLKSEMAPRVPRSPPPAPTPGGHEQPVQRAAQDGEDVP